MLWLNGRAQTRCSVKICGNGRSRRRGITLIYLFVVMIVLVAFASLAVDLGRAQLAKTELRRAADAAARYGAAGFATGSVSANAIAAAAQNTVDGTPLVLQAGDITTVTWSNGTIVAGNPAPNAIQVTARRLNSRGTGIPLLFAGILGQKTLDITVKSTAAYAAPVNLTMVANSKGDPWLAGMPNGTTANSFDSAPSNSPTLVGLNLAPGAKLNFSFTGAASYKPTAVKSDSDGDQTRNIYNCYYDGFAVGREHGLANLTAPIGAVVGVFLDNTRPDLAGAPPTDLDFSDPQDRNFSNLSPQLRQPFFIGDGEQANGTQQDFIVPPGATRLYIGIMDGQQWSDNSGSFSATTKQPATITLVK